MQQDYDASGGGSSVALPLLTKQKVKHKATIANEKRVEEERNEIAKDGGIAVGILVGICRNEMPGP
eukprot:scaffold167804_cov33-Tisochrysis_lutea.AAC.1